MIIFSLLLRRCRSEDIYKALVLRQYFRVNSCVSAVDKARILQWQSQRLPEQRRERKKSYGHNFAFNLGEKDGLANVNPALSNIHCGAQKVIKFIRGGFFSYSALSKVCLCTPTNTLFDFIRKVAERLQKFPIPNASVCWHG